MIRFYKANMAGPSHIDQDIPCQDSCFILTREDGIVAAACADGLGSERYSDVGSRIAAETAVTYCAKHYSCDMTLEEAKQMMKTAFVQAYQAVLAEANQAGNSEDEYDTTLCLALYDGKRVRYGQSGDSGMAILLENGEYQPVTVQQRDSEGYVFPLCSGPEMWEFGETDQPVSAVMLMTDGVWEQICPPLLRCQERKINIALARKFMERDEIEEAEIRALEAAAASYLEKYPRRLLDDDKTIVVLYNPERPAKKREDAYYKEPDWKMLCEHAKKRLYPPAREEKEVKKPPYSSERRRNVMGMAAFFLLGILAYVLSDFVREHAPVSYLGVLFACFFANASVLLPAPSILIVVQYALLLNPVIVAGCGAAGAALGEMVGFGAGACGSQLTEQKRFRKIERLIPKYPYGMVFVFSALPFPIFDVIGLAAGAMKLNPYRFFFACFLGKLVKMLSFAKVASVAFR